MTLKIASKEGPTAYFAMAITYAHKFCKTWIHVTNYVVCQYAECRGAGLR